MKKVALFFWIMALSLLGYLKTKDMLFSNIQVKFKIINDIDKSPITPDIIQVNEYKFKSCLSIKLKKGSYKIKIMKQGFKTLEFNQKILGSSNKQQIEKMLIALPRKVSLEVIYPRRVIPRIATLNNISIYKKKIFKPGVYTLFVNGGYTLEYLKKRIKIPTGIREFKIRVILPLKKRPLFFRITSNPPIENSKLTFHFKDIYENKTFVFKMNSKKKIYPSEYQLIIKKENIEVLRTLCTITRGEHAYILKYNLSNSNNFTPSRNSSKNIKNNKEEK